MPFIEYDDVVEQIAAADTHPSFGHSILPRAA